MQILLFIISIIFVLFPQKIWGVAESWKQTEKGTPSRRYLMMMRCIGAVLPAAGIFAAIGV